MSAAASPAPPALSPPLVAAAPRSWPSTPVLWIAILVLTAGGAFLRFWRLGYQAYWTDEAYTVDRIRDSFYYMLSSLSTQGFPPGWYALLRTWRIILTHWTGPADAYQPEYLRMLPAFFGTLTVPAFYLLARQFTDRRGALLVMLLAAVNPFLIYYSRDIKMYAGLWFFVVLNMALFFQWLTTRRHLLWFPLYLLSGVAMTSMHAMAGAMIGLQFLFILTRPGPRGWEMPLWMTAVAAMAWMPAFWFLRYAQPAKWAGRLSSDVDQGMDWIQQYTDMSYKTIGSLPTSYIFGYLWPVYPPDERMHNWFLLGGDDFARHLATRSSAWMAQWQLYCAWTLLAILALGLLPWRRFIGKKLPRLAAESAVTRGRWWWIFLWIALPTATLALTWIPPESPWFDRIWGWKSEGQKPLWEPRYLGIILPALLLWLGASLRRLPTLVLRTAAIAFVAAVCTFSSLSNHLLYRNPPFNRADAILERYINKDDRFQTAVAVPEVKYPYPAENVCETIARHVIPGSVDDLIYLPVNQAGRPYNPDPLYWPGGLDTEFEVRDWLTRIRQDGRINTIVLTDRYGDVTATNDMLSNESLEKILAPQWKLVDEETYDWHYEWRFYIFHTWRTRVWVRNP